MTRTRYFLTLLCAVILTSDAAAQFVPVFGLPVIGQGGISFHMGGKRLRIDGFLPLGDPYPAILPVTPTPFGLRQVGPAYLPYGYGYGYGYGYPPVAPGFPFNGYGAIDHRITVQIINPPVLPPQAGLRIMPDLSGIDLDLQPASAIWGEKPALAKNGKGMKKGELVKAPVKPIEIAKAEPEDKKPLVAANQQRAAVKLPPPNGQRLNELGVAAFRDGEYGLAMLRFRQATDADQPAARAFFLQGHACLAVGKYRDAVEAIQQGLQLIPAWPTSGFNPKVELYANHADEWKEHRQQLEQTQARQPKNADVLFLLGYLSWFDGERGAAVDYFTQARALAAEPRWADVFLKAAKK